MKFEEKDFEEKFTKWLDTVATDELIKGLKECGLQVQEETIDYKRECEVLRLQLHLLREEKDYTIKKQQKEINKCKQLFEKAISELVKSDKKSSNKDKIIDEMAKTINILCTGIPAAKEQFEKNYCEFINSDEDCCWKTDKDCTDCIKQYFERKAENNR